MAVVATKPRSYNVRLPTPHPKQAAFIDSTAKRICIRAGRRGGKSVGVGIRAVLRFLAQRRVLYAAPTHDQLQRFWATVTRALREPIDAGVLYKNETEHIIELKGTEQRIRAKTAWNADTLRGDYADDLILDEWQLMDEDAWGLVGAPMLLDNNGDATFIYTPPSLNSHSVSKAKDPQHAAKLFRRYKMQMEAGNPRYAAYHFSSHDNPYISKEALSEITSDMTALAYRMEIEAQDVDEAPGALWTRDLIERTRQPEPMAHYDRIVVSIDPSTTSTGDEAGIITAGLRGKECDILADNSIQGSPRTWATAAVAAYNKWQADAVVAEKNNGGEMISLTIATVDKRIPVRLVHASRGKQTRAEPVASLFEHDRAHIAGNNNGRGFALLEDEMCLWTPGENSPNRMDAMVWAVTELALGPGKGRFWSV
jgi:hypothetical protein